MLRKTAWDAKREAAMARLGAPAQQPSSAYAPGPYSGELPHSRPAAGGGEPLEARPSVIGDWSAYQEIHPEQLRRAAPEPPVHAHRGSGGDVRPVSTVPRDADELYRSLPRTAQETSVKVA